MFPLPKLVGSHNSFHDILYSKEIVGEIVYLFLFSVRAGLIFTTRGQENSYHHIAA